MLSTPVVLKQTQRAPHTTVDARSARLPREQRVPIDALAALHTHKALLRPFQERIRDYECFYDVSESPARRPGSPIMQRGLSPLEYRCWRVGESITGKLNSQEQQESTGISLRQRGRFHQAPARGLLNERLEVFLLIGRVWSRDSRVQRS